MIPQKIKKQIMNVAKKTGIALTGGTLAGKIFKLFMKTLI